jgi:hypothetical protein
MGSFRPSMITTSSAPLSPPSTTFASPSSIHTSPSQRCLSTQPLDDALSPSKGYPQPPPRQLAWARSDRRSTGPTGICEGLSGLAQHPTPAGGASSPCYTVSPYDKKIPIIIFPSEAMGHPPCRCFRSRRGSGAAQSGRTSEEDDAQNGVAG